MTFKIRKRGDEFVAIHVESGREVARSHSRALLESYCDDCRRLNP
jgi:hypothetical protein